MDVPGFLTSAHTVSSGPVSSHLWRERTGGDEVILDWLCPLFSPETGSSLPVANATKRILQLQSMVRGCVLSGFCRGGGEVVG